MKKFVGSLAVRLTVWFLLLSILPLAVVAAFPRQNAEKVMVQYFLDQAHNQARSLAVTFGVMDEKEEIQAIVTTWTTNNGNIYLIDKNGFYLAHPDPAKNGASLLDAFSSQTVAVFLAAKDGSMIEHDTARIIGYATLPTQDAVVLVVIDNSFVQSIMSNIGGTTLLQLALSLVVISVMGGLIIWRLVGRPLHQLTQAAGQIGQGKLDVRLAEGEMDDELKILAASFNQMSGQLQEQVRGLESQVTELQQAQEALQESEHRFASIFRLSPQSIALSTLTDGRYISVNDEFLRFTGYSREEVIGHTSAELQIWTDPASRSQALVVLQEQGVLRGFEVPVRHKSGASRSALFSAAPITIENLPCLLTIAVDITDRKQGETALNKRAAQLALLSDVGSQIAALLAVDEVLKQAACLVQQYFGYHHVGVFVLDRQRNMLVMRAKAGNFTKLFPDDHVLALNQGIVGWVGAQGQSLLANDVDAEPRYVNLYPDVVPTRSELSVPVKMGSNILGVLDIQSPNYDAFDENDVMVMETLAGQIAVALENAHLYQSVQQELHERMQAEQELRVESGRAQRYLDTASVILVALDDRGVITLLNRQGHEILEYAEGELLGQSWFDVCLPEPFREGTRDVFHQLMRGEAVSAAYYENPVLTKTGKERLIAWHNTLIRDDAGKIVGALSSGEDITESRRAEEQIRASLAEKEVLLREIHHRVKNNMQVMISLLNLQANQLPDAQTRSALLESQNRIRSMALVHESLYQSANLSQVNFQDYLHKLLPYLQTVYMIRSSIRLNLEAEPVSLSIDQAIPCGLIVNELVSNAIKHAFPGERDGEVVVRLAEVDRRIRLTVSDDGIGIPDDLDIYHTASLGMQLITILTTQLDGTLELKRQGGTTFQITF